MENSIQILPIRNILIATAEPSAKDNIAKSFNNQYNIDEAEDRQTVLQFFKQKKYEFAFLGLPILVPETDPKPPLKIYAECLDDFIEISPHTEIVVICSPNRVREAVQAVRSGANSYLIHPIDPEEVKYTVESTYETWKMQAELENLKEEFWVGDMKHITETKSPVMQKVFNSVKHVARTNSTILLTGETGTGKGIIAQLIHAHGQRKDAPFIGVHCGAIPDNLIESELFGHEKGSFTGAINQKLGKFELAKGGTIFLDEIGTMNLGAQIKILKILQEKTFQRVGGEKDIEIDVRVIAATNINLIKMAENGGFRQDLYYRLNVFPVEVPPLRERKEDIPQLVDFFLKQLNANYQKGIKGVHRLVLKGFDQYAWPGNIRELENVIERAYILETSSMLMPEHFPSELVPYVQDMPVVSLDVSDTLANVRNNAIEEVEKKYVQEKLALYKGRVDKTAEAAGITPRQLHKLMVKYDIHSKSFK